MHIYLTILGFHLLQFHIIHYRTSSLVTFFSFDAVQVLFNISCRYFHIQISSPTRFTLFDKFVWFRTLSKINLTFIYNKRVGASCVLCFHSLVDFTFFILQKLFRGSHAGQIRSLKYRAWVICKYIISISLASVNGLCEKVKSLWNIDGKISFYNMISVDLEYPENCKTFVQIADKR